MQIWGNKLANLYWEKHLKPGHVPPEQYVPSSSFRPSHNSLSSNERTLTSLFSLHSKIESFIRSKYESKRWAMSGPRPDNPKDLLEEGGGEYESAPAVVS